MAVSAAYSVTNICDAIANADTYLYTAGVTGIYEAVDLVVDAELALVKANLNKQEKAVVDYRMKKGYTQEDTASVMQISQPRIHQIESSIKKKIGAVIRGWEQEDAV